VDQSPVDVRVGAVSANGSTVAMLVVSVPCPVANGEMTLEVQARVDGAGNRGDDPVVSSVWVRDTLPPVTVANLGRPDLFVPVSTTNGTLLVTNFSSMSVLLSSGTEPPRGFAIAVSRTDPPTTRQGIFVNVSQGEVDVELPWSGPQIVSVVRDALSYVLDFLVSFSRLLYRVFAGLVRSARI
jgi:hypothetical protein